MRLAAPGWPAEPAAAGIRVDTAPDGFRVVGGGLDECAGDAWEAAHWVLAAAIGDAAEARSGRFVLNAGALLADGEALVFAGQSHAGKSSVALHLAAGGAAMLGDDRLILDTAGPVATAAGLGLSRKVRTPVPMDFSASARSLAARTAVGNSAGADVLAWDAAVDRPAGTAAPVGQVVLLAREPSLGSARMTPLGAAEAVAALLSLCGRHAGSAADLLDAVAGLVARVPVRRLEAPGAAAAAAVLLTERA